ncbi:hypothetical protein ACRALDRAFT_210817 [Sodiomyces alcalophilus JCM 7366]|uniref:uncharacterized protein n=1 Tax=Sodiomyces alcalophilus JCM 7366 TaxID=591952 RepID=UPI0039B67C9E
MGGIDREQGQGRPAAQKTLEIRVHIQMSGSAASLCLPPRESGSMSERKGVWGGNEISTYASSKHHAYDDSSRIDPQVWEVPNIVVMKL